MPDVEIIFDLIEGWISLNGLKVFLSRQCMDELTRRGNIDWSQYKNHLPKTWRDF